MGCQADGARHPANSHLADVFRFKTQIASGATFLNLIWVRILFSTSNFKGGARRHDPCC